MSDREWYRERIRPGSLPHFFCPGCGCGQIMNFFLQAAEEVDLDFDNLVAVGGVGCTARIPVYLDADALHGIHGRVLPWATGIKLHKPELDVVVFAGDGGVGAIGGNHFIQAARRNLDVTVIVVNNLNFAMTGGQVSPTTPSGLNTMTTPYGNREERFDLYELARSAGATSFSRWNTFRYQPATDSIKSALDHRGFSVVEIISQCPTHFGRYALGSGEPTKGMEWIEDKSITIAEADGLTDGEKKDKFVLGDFYSEKRPIFEGSTVYGEEK
ncbi:2-oxoacid:ferredoxin oxidoreductase subunit beta [Candidatus Bipolaricaulota bacterium]|nr:2-oxoacid:ferredoxin oxidoreductase subunit beta [Candidatus Bipolaricaulota bacterium]